MTGPEHYREGLRLLEKALRFDTPGVWVFGRGWRYAELRLQAAEAHFAAARAAAALGIVEG